VVAGCFVVTRGAAGGPCRSDAYRPVAPSICSRRMSALVPVSSHTRRDPARWHLLIKPDHRKPAVGRRLRSQLSEEGVDRFAERGGLLDTWSVAAGLDHRGSAVGEQAATADANAGTPIRSVAMQERRRARRPATTPEGLPAAARPSDRGTGRRRRSPSEIPRGTPDAVLPRLPARQAVTQKVPEHIVVQQRPLYALCCHAQ
jgi:hypothetical protein